LHFAGTDDWDVLESRAEALANELREEGRRPFVMPNTALAFVKRHA
jgi:hypothetical protein